MTDDLLARIEELRAEVAHLKRLLAPEPKPIPREWRLTPAEARLLVLICTREEAHRDWLMDALYALDPGEPPQQKIIDVWICKLRAKLEPYGHRISTIWGRGYAASPELRAAVLGVPS